MAQTWDVPRETIRTANGEVWAEHQPPHADGEGGRALQGPRRGAVGSASFGTDTTAAPKDGAGRPLTGLCVRLPGRGGRGRHGDRRQVLGVWAAHDVGRAVNPKGVEGQIEGGIVRALGQG